MAAQMVPSSALFVIMENECKVDEKYSIVTEKNKNRKAKKKSTEPFLPLLVR